MSTVSRVTQLWGLCVWTILKGMDTKTVNWLGLSLATLMLVLTGACQPLQKLLGSNSSSNSGTTADGGSSANVTVVGRVSAAPVAFAQVKAHTLDSAGNRSDFLGVTKTDADGYYSLSVPRSVVSSSTIEFQASGEDGKAVYIDEGTLKQRTLSANMTVWLPPQTPAEGANAVVPVAVTDLTSPIVDLAKKLVAEKGVPIGEAVVIAELVMRQAIGMDSNLLSTLPAHPTKVTLADSRGAREYAKALADHAVNAVKVGAKSPQEYANAVGKDFEDGKFDGLDPDGAAIQIMNSDSDLVPLVYPNGGFSQSNGITPPAPSGDSDLDAGFVDWLVLVLNPGLRVEQPPPKPLSYCAIRYTGKALEVCTNCCNLEFAIGPNKNDVHLSKCFNHCAHPPDSSSSLGEPGENAGAGGSEPWVFPSTLPTLVPVVPSNPPSPDGQVGSTETPQESACTAEESHKLGQLSHKHQEGHSAKAIDCENYCTNYCNSKPANEFDLSCCAFCSRGTQCVNTIGVVGDHRRTCKAPSGSPDPWTNVKARYTIECHFNNSKYVKRCD